MHEHAVAAEVKPGRTSRRGKLERRAHRARAASSSTRTMVSAPANHSRAMAVRDHARGGQPATPGRATGMRAAIARRRRSRTAIRRHRA
jgi:hypothetical protein